MRIAQINRKTKETDIQLTLNLDGQGKHHVDTGIGFFNHMLTAFAVHSGCDLDISCIGDLEVDCHHSVEDTGIVLGMAFAKALADKSGISRYGNFSIPMDESLATCSLDISGRPYLVFRAQFTDSRIGDMDTQMIEEFFRAFAVHAQVTLHINVPYGANDHHICEAIFKAVAHAVKEAVKMREGQAILSSKGVL